jgi:ABC-2 type transport system permease protein
VAYLRLFGLFLRLGVINELEYRINFYIQVLQSLISLGIGVGGLAIVFSQTTTLGGWGPAEMLALLGVYTLVAGVIGVVIQPSMERLMEDVRQGTLDFALTKPEDSQALISVRQVSVWKLVDIGLGAAVLAVALEQLGTTIGVGQAAAFAVALLAGVLIVYSFWLILATTSFWFVRIDNILVIFQSMFQAARWPVGIFPTWLRAILTFVVPVAFATTVPAEALAGRLTWQTLVGAIALAGALLAVSRWFWGVGVRHYSGASA